MNTHLKITSNFINRALHSDSNEQYWPVEGQSVPPLHLKKFTKTLKSFELFVEIADRQPRRSVPEQGFTSL